MPAPAVVQPKQSASGYEYDQATPTDHQGNRSAQVIAPLLCGFVRPRSVVDVGCGIGLWLRAMRACAGVEETHGIDGSWVPREKIQISAEDFFVRDLNAPIPAERRYDLALCLEVAEHLPERAAQGLVASLVGLAPAVLFSAAVPAQGGFEHINEHFQDYWIAEFARHGFTAHDVIRPRVWTDARVQFYYAQNALLYLDPHATPAADILSRIAAAPAPPLLPTPIHPELYLRQCHQLNSLRGTLTRVPVLLGRALRRRLPLGGNTRRTS